MAEQLDAVDFAVAAYRRDGRWVVQELAHDLEADVEVLAHALRRFSGDAGAVALVGLDDDFFVILRVAGAHTRVLLSDISAADEWELAASIVDFLGLPFPEDGDDQVPAGDLDLLGDLGLPEIEMGLLLDDTDLYPEELLSDIARRVGFGKLFDDAVGLTPA
ncbi:tRNA adenosine deaminase-associated protein [Nocardioides plantarum]|uniref:tRNA adenosine deaminase-associated protein n=1 Tax=Nocardioides plantarum TaxID=29299 RepID=A0ABV5KEW7_9ACTN|nr:tRNA adenosine deaminase-associated protein [Nocardioides plantarum]